MNGDEKVIEFAGRPSRLFYSSENFKMYAFTVDKNDYPEVKQTKYQSVTVKGNLHTLTEGQLYHIKAIEESNSDYGYSYNVVEIRGENPKTEFDMFLFLKEILTFNQVTELWREYPDIIDRVREGRLKDVDLSKLKGIGESSFKSICKKIEENYVFADIITEFHGIFSYSVLMKLHEKYPSVERIREVLKKDPYKFLTDLDRIGFKKADGIILNLEKKGVFGEHTNFKESKQRCMAYIKYTLLKNEGDGNTKYHLKKLLDSCKREVRECSSHFLECIRSDVFHVEKDEKSISLQSAYFTESYIADRLHEALEIKDKKYTDEIITESEDGIKLTDEQIQGIQNLWDYQISILNGWSGTGKSQTVNAIIRSLKKAGKSFVLLAPTGRAAKVLAEYANEEAATIHRGLHYMPGHGWMVNKDNPLTEEVVVVDEFSMVDIYLFKHLLNAIDFNRTKLLIIGDSAQLNSVSAGNCLHDMIDSKVVPLTTLTKIFRYSEGGLMKVATDTRNCKPYLDANKITEKAVVFGKNKDYTFITSRKETMLKDVKALYRKCLDDGYKPEDILVLSAYNKGDFGTIKLNSVLQPIANPNSVKTKGFKAGDKIFYLNDIVIQTVNNYKSVEWDTEQDQRFDIECLICNGEIGKIERIMDNGILIKFGDQHIYYTRSNLSTVQLGYAISIHRVQGGSGRIIIMLSPDAHQFMLNSNLLYVGLTRMKEKCYHLGVANTINKAVRKKENLSRQTYLRKLLEMKK